MEYQQTVRENCCKVQQLLKNKCEHKDRAALEADLNVRLGDIGLVAIAIKERKPHFFMPFA